MFIYYLTIYYFGCKGTKKYYLCTKIREKFGTEQTANSRNCTIPSGRNVGLDDQRCAIGILGVPVPSKPKTSGPAKIRQYQEKDIEQLRTIHNLVKIRGFKLAAAKKMINANRKGADMRADVLTRLIAVRDDLQALKKQLDYVQ